MNEKKLTRFILSVLAGVVFLVIAAVGQAGEPADDVAELRKQVAQLRERVQQLEASAKSSIPLPAMANPTDPGVDIQRLQAEQDRAFQNRFSSKSRIVEHSQAIFDPPMEFSPTSTHYVFRVELPGMSKDNIKVDVRDRMLTVSGERTEIKENNQANSQEYSQSFGSFSKTVSLPPDADENNIVSDYVNGFLTVKVAKKAVGGKTPDKKTIKVR